MTEEHPDDIPPPEEGDLINGLRDHANRLAAIFDPMPEGQNESASEIMRSIAEDYERKRLFVCCDGTWNNASGAVAPMTNVAKLARAVYRVGSDEFQIPKSAVGNNDLPDEDQRYGVVRQVVYYSSGVGSQSSLAVDSLFSGAFGKGIDASILSAYCFICNNFNGRSCLDEIILVGFSRGAFTVRCLAHFINAVGLLRRKALVFLRSIYRSWKRSAEGEKGALKRLETELAALDRLRIESVRIKVLAEWDTVSAVRSLRPWKKKLSFVNDEVPGNVDYAFHAVALHEKRRSFKPMLWKMKAEADTTVQQCAFVGCHSDIGGGNPDPGLSTSSLLWMISQIQGASKAKFDHTTLLQFITPLQTSFFRKTVDDLVTWPWDKPVMRLHNLASTKGRVNESRKGLWRLAYYLSLGLLDGKRDVFLDQFAKSQNTNQGEQLYLERPRESVTAPMGEALGRYLESDRDDRWQTLRQTLAELGLQETPLQRELQLRRLLLREQTRTRLGLTPKQLEELWLTQQRIRGMWLERDNGVGLQIHFTARLHHSRLKSDSRLKCGLFRRFESNIQTQTWHKKTSNTLFLPEASVNEHEKELLDTWIKVASAQSQQETVQDHLIDREGIDWTRIQRSLDKVGWGGYVNGCIGPESLISLIKEEFERLGVRNWEETEEIEDINSD
ncbi:hypothetical protein F52700_3171 [Fusarium sp. NRRL 52700]|nr:hypothetical protein F52700_3171 [Fusarium sp. NRRL 52700]